MRSTIDRLLEAGEQTLKLLFHVGLNKAGSTFIQDLYSRNVQAMRLAGVHYPNAHVSSGHAEATSGNAGQFALDLGIGREKRARDFLQDQVAAAASLGCHSMLLSTEYMYHRLVRPSVAESFKATCSSVGISDIRLLVIFRDPASHAISAYNHRAGAKATLAGFESWLRTHYELFGELELFLRYLAKDEDLKIDVRNFRDGLTDIATDFVNVELPCTLAGRPSNVSITCVEAEVVRQIASENPHLASAVKRGLKRLTPDQKAGDEYLRATFRAAVVKHAQSSMSQLRELERLADSEFPETMRHPEAQRLARMESDASDQYLLSYLQMRELLHAASKEATGRWNPLRIAGRAIPLPLKRHIAARIDQVGIRIQARPKDS